MHETILLHACVCVIVGARLACSSTWLGKSSWGNFISGIALDHQLIIYSQVLATGLIRTSIVYRVHSNCALKYAGKPWIHQIFLPMFQKHYFAKLFYHRSFLLYRNINDCSIREY